MTTSFIDPKNGDINQNLEDPNKKKEESISISKEEWQSLKTRLDVYERQFSQFQKPAPIQQTPQVPAGPSYEDEIKAVETQIDTLDDQIEEAIENGKSVKNLRKQQRQLQTKLTRLTVEHESIAPLRRQGMQTLTYLTSEVTRSKMPYYDLVKDDMQAFLNQLSEEQRADPKIQEFAYKSCVGDSKVLTQILAAEKEKILRDAATATVPDVSGSGRGAAQNKKVPAASKILGPQAMAALREKGISVDQHYKTFGYAGWEDYWEKKGNKHFQDYVDSEEK